MSQAGLTKAEGLTSSQASKNSRQADSREIKKGEENLGDTDDD
jgi:hypothetical protein